MQTEVSSVDNKINPIKSKMEDPSHAPTGVRLSSEVLSAATGGRSTGDYCFKCRHYNIYTVIVTSLTPITQPLIQVLQLEIEKASSVV